MSSQIDWTHPKIKELYTKYGFEIPYNAPTINEKEFYEQTLPETRRTKVSSIIRVAHDGDDGPQYLKWHETIIGETLEGNPRYHVKNLGEYNEPQFIRETDNTGRVFMTERVSRVIVRHEKEFSEANVREIMARNTAKDFPEQKMGFMLDVGERKYSVPSVKDFLTPSVEELLKKLRVKG